MVVVIASHMQILKRLIKRPAIAPVATTAVEEPRPEYGFFGDYPTFEAALADGTPYDSVDIARRIAAQIPKFFADEFCEIDGRYQQVHSTLVAVARRLGKDRLSVLDVGGGNGNNFIAARKMDPSFRCDWTILETQSMCDACSGLLPIRWISAAPTEQFDVVLISGTLQCLPSPYDALAQFSKNAPWLIIHRTPLISRDRDRLMNQIVDQAIDPGKVIAHWFLSGEKLRLFLGSIGRIHYSWRNTQDDPAYVQVDGKTFGFLIKTFVGG